MQTASIQWIGEQKFLAVSPSGHAVPFDSDRYFFFQAEDGILVLYVTGVQTCALPICFFFQAEDGIRDLYVTGVQTCALPISRAPLRSCRRHVGGGAYRGRGE